MPVARADDHPSFDLGGNTITGFASPSRGATECILYRVEVRPGAACPPTGTTIRTSSPSPPAAARCTSTTRCTRSARRHRGGADRRAAPPGCRRRRRRDRRDDAGRHEVHPRGRHGVGPALGRVTRWRLLLGRHAVRRPHGARRSRACWSPAARSDGWARTRARRGSRAPRTRSRAPAGRSRPGLIDVPRAPAVRRRPTSPPRARPHAGARRRSRRPRNAAPPPRARGHHRAGPRAAWPR